MTGRVCRWLLMALAGALVVEAFVVDDYFHIDIRLGTLAVPIYGGIASLALTGAALVALLVWLFAIRGRLPAVTRARSTQIAALVSVLLGLGWLAAGLLLAGPAEINSSGGSTWQTLLADSIGVCMAISIFIFIGRASRLAAGAPAPRTQR